MSQQDKYIRSTRDLGDFLIERGLISPDQYRIARLRANQRDQSLAQALEDLDFLPQTEWLAQDMHPEDSSAQALQLDTLPPPSASLLNKIPRALAVRLKVFPAAEESTSGPLLIACATPDNLAVHTQLQQHLVTTPTFRLFFAPNPAIEQAIDKYYGYAEQIDELLEQMATVEGSRSAERITTQMMPQLVEALLADAVRYEASDIHIEPERDYARIRYRIDGVLRSIKLLPANIWPSLLVCLKLLSGMDIADARKPQDGRFSQRIAGRDVDFRSSCLPTLHGENLVLRILDRNKTLLSLSELGLSANSEQQLRKIQQIPEGLILITGPTGSGKTTTLYALLQQANHSGVNIMTLEEPIEHPLAQIRQTPAGEAGTISFSDGIRALLRQDPDILMIGEIRDQDSARMALQAAMTGHRVYASLHANSALAAIPRLIDLGISPHMIASSLCGVLAQRLLRRLCTDCQGDGCPACDWQGYRGRVAIMEILAVDRELAALIGNRSGAQALEQYALGKGYQTLAAQALALAEQGVTSYREVERVVALST